jgi:microsomal dipeptidase-like Zn-dependent dipeptidase
MLRSGYGHADIRGILGGNWLRVFGEVRDQR